MRRSSLYSAAISARAAGKASAAVRQTAMKRRIGCWSARWWRSPACLQRRTMRGCLTLVPPPLGPPSVYTEAHAACWFPWVGLRLPVRTRTRTRLPTSHRHAMRTFSCALRSDLRHCGSPVPMPPRPLQRPQLVRECSETGTPCRLQDALSRCCHSFRAAARRGSTRQGRCGTFRLRPSARRCSSSTTSRRCSRQRSRAVSG